MRNREKLRQWSTLFSKDIKSQLGGIIVADLTLLFNPLLLEAGVRSLEFQYLYIHGSLKPSGTAIWNNKTVHCPWTLSLSIGDFSSFMKIDFFLCKIRFLI